MNLGSYIPAGANKPGALTAGLCLFICLLYVVNLVTSINNYLVLEPGSLFKLDLGRLSLYPLAHLSFLHVLFNCISIIVPLSVFESTHGTIYTAVMLNMLAVVSGVIYCIVGSLFFPNVSVGGASGWAFSLCAYFAVKETQARSGNQSSIDYRKPALYYPLLFLVVIAVLVPQSSFVGHAIGLGLGYFMGFKEELVMKITPPSWIIIKIETWLDQWISIIPPFVVYYRESIVDRSRDYSPLYQQDVLPLHHNDTFQGQGRMLGA